MLVGKKESQLFERTTVPDRDKKSNNGRLGQKRDGKRRRRQDDKEHKTFEKNEAQETNGCCGRRKREEEGQREERERGRKEENVWPIEVEVVLKEAQDREKAGKETIRRARIAAGCGLAYSQWPLMVGELQIS